MLPQGRDSEWPTARLRWDTCPQRTFAFLAPFGGVAALFRGGELELRQSSPEGPDFGEEGSQSPLSLREGRAAPIGLCLKATVDAPGGPLRAFLSLAPWEGQEER